jgi:hypothetical protein
MSICLRDVLEDLSYSSYAILERGTEYLDSEKSKLLDGQNGPQVVSNRI